MCSTAAIGPAIGAIGDAAGVAQQNAEKRKNWNHYLKVRERRWMQRRTTFASKKVQFEQEIDLSNIAAQRAYSTVDNKLNIARSQAILDNQGDFLKMIQGSGDVAAKAASRGVQGNSLAKMLITHQSQFGMTQAMRTRGLTMAYSQAEKEKDYVRNQLKARQNRAFSKVAIEEVPDIAKPPPTMGNPGMALMLGMGQAVAAGIGGMDGKTMDAGGGTENVVPVTPPTTPNYFMPSNPQFTGVGANTSYGNNSYGVQRFTYGR